MTDNFDFAIAGSTPLCGVLAGILARDHGAKVCRIGHFVDALLPQRGFDISAGPITRPDTWRLLKSSVPETVKLLNGISNAKVYERIDYGMVALGKAGVHGLDYIQNAARGYGAQTERLPDSSSYRTAYAFRHTVRTLRRPLIAALPAWLDAQGVVDIEPADARIRKAQNGPISVNWSGGEAEIGTLILAGDAAMLAHGHQGDVQSLFHKLPMAALLLETSPKLVTPVMQAIDAGLTLYQRSNGALDCAGHGKASELGQAAAAYFEDGEKLRLAGSAVFDSLLSRDGGAVFGAKARKNVIYLGGLGVTGLFQAPAIARHLAGKSNTLEADYFKSCAPPKGEKLKRVGEFMAPRLELAVA